MARFYPAGMIISGNGSLKIIGKQVKQRGLSKVLIVTDPLLAQGSIIYQVEQSLHLAKVETVIFDQVEPNPRDTTCDAGAALARSQKVHGIVAVGGGSAMDTGKTIAALLTNGGTCRDWSERELLHKILPTVCIPTTAGTGSEVTSVAVITDTELHFKMGIGDPEHMVPILAIDDPELTVTLPSLMTAATGMDTLTHAVEAYTCKVAQPLTDALALFAIEQVGKYLERAVKYPDDLEARSAMLYSATMAGMAFINSNVGSVHALSETIGALYDTPHGIANAIFLPHVMAFNTRGNERRFAEIALRFGVRTEGISDAEASNQCIQRVVELSHAIGIPKLKDLPEIRPDDFEKIANLAAENSLSADNARKVTARDYLTIIFHTYEF